MWYHAVSEYKLDHERTCGHCGQKYEVLLRAFGKTDFPSRSERATTAEVYRSGLEDAWRSAYLYHRCTKCGHYDNEDLSKIQGAYSSYCSGRKKRSYICVGIAIFLVVFSFSTITILGTWDWALSSSGIPGWLFFYGGTLFLFLIAWITWPMSEDEFLTRLKALNSSRTVNMWLAQWNKEMPVLRKKFGRARNDPFRHRWLWSFIEDVQHKYDPFKIYWAKRAALTRPGILEKLHLTTGKRILVFFFGASVLSAAIIGISGVQNEFPDGIRIISLSPNLTDVLYDLGLEEQVVEVPDFTGQSVTRSQPVLGEILAAKPDLVLTMPFPGHLSALDELRKNGVNCLVFDIKSINDLFEAIKDIGQASYSGETARRLIKHLRAEIQELTTIFAAEERPRVLWIQQREPLIVAGSDSFITEMIWLAGGKNAVDHVSGQQAQLQADELIALRPDIVFDAAFYDSQLGIQSVEIGQIYGWDAGFSADDNVSVYVVEGDVSSWLGPRLPEAITTLNEYIVRSSQLKTITP